MMNGNRYDTNKRKGRSEEFELRVLWKTLMVFLDESRMRYESVPWFAYRFQLNKRFHGKERDNFGNKIVGEDNCRNRFPSIRRQPPQLSGNTRERKVKPLQSYSMWIIGILCFFRFKWIWTGQTMTLRFHRFNLRFGSASIHKEVFNKVF